MKVLATGALVATAVFLGLHFASDEFRAEFDPWMLLFIGAVYAIFVARVLFVTRVWTLFGIGILFAFVGDTMLYLPAALAIHLEWMPPVWVIDLARTAFVTSLIFLLVAVLWKERKERVSYEV